MLEPTRGFNVAPRRTPAAAPTSARARLPAAGIFEPRRAHRRIVAALPCRPGSCPSPDARAQPRGGFGETRGKPLRHQWHETPGARDVGIVAHRRADRLGWRGSNGMTFGAFRERTAPEPR